MQAPLNAGRESRCMTFHTELARVAEHHAPDLNAAHLEAYARLLDQRLRHYGKRLCDAPVLLLLTAVGGAMMDYSTAIEQTGNDVEFTAMSSVVANRTGSGLVVIAAEAASRAEGTPPRSPACDTPTQTRAESVPANP